MKQTLPEYIAVTRDFYETNAEQYAQNTSDMLDEEWLERFSNMLPDHASVLDIGCASGRDSAWFSSRGYQVSGIDIAPTFIELARSKVPSGDFRVMNVTSLDFEPESFDGVWCSCVLIHLSDEDVLRAINEIWRVLKPGGILYMLVKAGTKEGYERDSRYDNMRKYSNYFSEEGLRSMIHDFDVVSFTSVDKPVDNYRAPDRIFVLAKKASFVS